MIFLRPLSNSPAIHERLQPCHDEISDCLGLTAPNLLLRNQFPQKRKSARRQRQADRRVFVIIGLGWYASK